MKMTYSTGFKLCVFTWIAFAAGTAQALDTTVTLHADSEITPSSSELVTFGLPIAEGDVTDLAEIKVSIGGTEVPVYVESSLTHHWTDNSHRSVTLQLHNVDMTVGDVAVSISDLGAGVARLTELPHTQGWATAGADKNNLPYPRIFALHDTQYLASTGIIPPYTPAPDNGDAFEAYQVGQFNNWAGGLDYTGSRNANWLFDRSTAMFKAYMGTGRVEFLKEAFLSKQFYFQYVRDDSSAPAAPGGSGCWTYGSTACADGKYIAPQQAKLALALVGDDSQWDANSLVNMALQSDLGWNQHASRDAFDIENEGFTERGAGLAGLAEIVVYEMTGNSTVLSHLNERINSLKDMQQTVKSWDSANGWTPKSGGWTHNIDVHEGNYDWDSAPLNDSNARGFSAWMSENIVDFLWQTYWITGNTTIPGMLTRVADAVDTYGFTSSYNEVSGNHDTKSEFAALRDPVRSQSCNTTRDDTSLLYFGSAHADAARRTSDDWYPYYSDQHNIETVLILASGYYFEADAAVKVRLAARINKLVEGWANPNCAGVFSNVYRLWNWQHRSNSVRSWFWIADGDNAGGTDEIVIASPPNAPVDFAVQIVSDATSDGGSVDTGSGSGEAVVFVASTDCSVGDDPHWQCGGEWQSYNALQPDDYVAVCGGRESVDYIGCYGTDQFIQYSSVAQTDGFLVCNSGVALGGSRNDCNDFSYTFAENFGEAIVAVEPAQEAPTSEGTPVETAPDSTVGGGSGLSFANVTTTVIDQAPQVSFHFWAGMPDVNGDGCFDAYLGAHSDDVNSAMYIQDNVAGSCQGTFTYFPDADNYSQASPTSTRITSRYMWGNWYNHPEGLWSFYGHDVDGNPGAQYVLSPSSGYGENPTYEAKKYGCYDSQSTCIPLDVTGDGDIELVINSFDGTPLSRQIVNADDGSIEYASDTARDGDYGTSYVVLDIDNDGYPEVISTHAGGYWKYNSGSDSWAWVAGVFTNSIYSDTSFSTTNNHEVVLDYDSDGDMDIWSGRGHYSSDGQMGFVLARNNGDGTFTDVSVASGINSLGISNEDYWTTYGNSVVADINLDGHPDILISGETYGNAVTIVLNNGDGTFTVDRSISFGSSFVSDSGKPWVNAVDYDNDGAIDIVKTHERADASHASIGLFRNTTELNNHWLRIRARGVGENTDGLHTQITVFEPGTNNVITHYQVGAFSTGFQNLVIHAGLGLHANVDLEVQYPHGGPKYKFEGLAADQDVIVFHDGGIVQGYVPGSPIPLIN